MVCFIFKTISFIYFFFLKNFALPFIGMISSAARPNYFDILAEMHLTVMQACTVANNAEDIHVITFHTSLCILYCKSEKHWKTHSYKPETLIS